MGEKICTLGCIRIGSHTLELELNHGTRQEPYMIHLQNQLVNICLKDKEFIQAVASVLIAVENFKLLKSAPNE